MKKMIKKSQWLIVIKCYFCDHTWLQVVVSDKFGRKTSTKNAAENGAQAHPELVVVILNIEYMSLTEQP